MSEERKNPLLERVSVPGESFRLPSGALFYTDGEELVEGIKDGEVYIRPMTAVEELIMKSPDKLLSGAVVPEIFEKCIPDIKDPNNLLAKDVDYLLMCLRLVSYGPTIGVVAKHDCEEAKDHEYQIEVRPLLKQSKVIDPTSLKKKFHLKLEGGQVVDLHPPRYLSTIKLYQTFVDDEIEMNSEEIGLRMLESIADMISAVDGHEDAKDINEWIQHIRAGDVQSIADKISDLSDWGVDPLVHVECRDCKKEFDLVVPINPISFFT